jgi:hypothetical protein
VILQTPSFVSVWLEHTASEPTEQARHSDRDTVFGAGQRKSDGLDDYFPDRRRYNRFDEMPSGGDVSSGNR